MKSTIPAAIKEQTKIEPFTFTPPSDPMSFGSSHQEEKIDTSSNKQSWGFLGKLKKFFLGNTTQARDNEGEGEGYENNLQYVVITKTNKTKI